MPAVAAQLIRIITMKRILRAVLLLISLSLIATPAIAQDEVLKADWIMPEAPNQDPHQGIVFMEPTLYPSSTSYLISSDNNSSKYFTSEHVCKSINSDTCLTEKTISYQAYVPVCSDELSRNCIEDFWLVLNGKKFQPVLDTYMPTVSPLHFNGDSESNLPEGKSSSIWKIKDNELGNSELLFAVSAIFTGSTPRSNPKFGQPKISVVIDPVVNISGSYSLPVASKNGNGWSIGGCLHEGCGTNNIGYCAAIDVDKCAKRVNHINGVRYGIKLRITNPPITWIHGRLLDSEFTTKSTSNGVTWSIEAEPTMLPVTSGWIANSEYKQKMGVTLPRPEEGSWSGPLSSGTQAFQEFNKWIPFMGESAQAMQKRWSVATISSGEKINGKSLDSCLKPNAIAGLVVSNATVYQGEPPTWNSRDLTLDYKVAAPHLTSSGKEFLGIYQLKINSDFARCIYGLQDVPLSATISVVSTEGTNKIATSSIVMGSEWINFNVSGFTFSAPTIKVQVTEAKKEITTKSNNEVSKITSSPLTATKKAKKTTVSCVKGKVTKEITSINPKCPAGYKKK